jgi:hypothetical protein
MAASRQSEIEWDATVRLLGAYGGITLIPLAARPFPDRYSEGQLIVVSLNDHVHRTTDRSLDDIAQRGSCVVHDLAPGRSSILQQVRRTRIQDGGAPTVVAEPLGATGIEAAYGSPQPHTPLAQQVFLRQAIAAIGSLTVQLQPAVLLPTTLFGVANHL